MDNSMGMNFDDVDSQNQPRSGFSAEAWIEASNDQLALCRLLEDIADSLPFSIDRQRCIHASRMIVPMIRRAHRYEEETMFPLLVFTDEVPSHLEMTIKRLKFEHFADQCFAEELAECLLQLGEGSQAINMEATGYMLRGFFEGIRRHIAFEQDYLPRRLGFMLAEPILLQQCL